MDMHIHMSYCSPSGLRILVSNYLGISDHKLFPEIDKLITEAEVTPAEIAEELLKFEDADVGLEELIKFLRRKNTKMIECETEVGAEKRKAREEVDGDENIVDFISKSKKMRSKRKKKSDMLRSKVVCEENALKLN